MSTVRHVTWSPLTGLVSQTSSHLGPGQHVRRTTPEIKPWRCRPHKYLKANLDLRGDTNMRYETKFDYICVVRRLTQEIGADFYFLCFQKHSLCGVLSLIVFGWADGGAA